MRRASYRAAVRWIAENDESGVEMTAEQCGELISAALVADLFGVESERVGRDIHKARLSIRARKGGLVARHIGLR